MQTKSPFPGMNPYLEHPDVWHDFHDSFLPALRDTLLEQLPEHYVCKLEEQVYVHELSESSGHLVGRADVAVLPTNFTEREAVGTSNASGPVQVELILAADTERMLVLEIRTRDGNQLVTVIELLSPANKRPGKDRDQYLAKRERILEGSVHLVEIDLLRKWPRMPARQTLNCDYCILISDARRRPMADVWPFSLQERIPTVPIPLLDGDTSVEIELQSVFERVFVAARYARYIYAKTPDPPLNPKQRAWAEEILK